VSAPLLIALPRGLEVGGVTTFAVRLANGLAGGRRGVTVVLHPEPRGQRALEIAWHPRVEVVRAKAGFEATPGDLSPFIPLYRDLARRLAAESGCPVAFAPQILGDCFGVAAALCLTESENARVLGWQHSDIEYDARVLARYEPIITRFVGVSDRICTTLRERTPGRAEDVVNIACGVEVPGEPPERRPGTGPLRLVYTGRLEHEQKRVLALVHLSEELDRRGVRHTLTVVGDGPAGAEFDRLAAGRPAIRRAGVLSPRAVAMVLADGDALVLPSRYEGLSVSMLEAMAAGCAPILARTRSGASQAVEAGHNGEIAEVEYEADERQTGLALAAAVERFLSRDRAAMSQAAWSTVREKFSIERHVEAVGRLIDLTAKEPARSWPADLPCAFTASAPTDDHETGSGSVPPDGAARLRALLETLAGRSIILHGAGQHTLQLAAILAASPARIVAVADDDRARHGEQLWGWPIIDPREASGRGATEVVISSWMHEDAIWVRRGLYERQGLQVHRVYAPNPCTIPV
jgi:glycosyltransferase involved in cell wall biosynthesis